MKYFWAVKKKYRLNVEFFYNELVVSRSVYVFMRIPIYYKPVCVNKRGEKIYSGLFTAVVMDRYVGTIKM
jgi:hypothetical protein